MRNCEANPFALDSQRDSQRVPFAGQFTEMYGGAILIFVLLGANGVLEKTMQIPREY